MLGNRPKKVKNRCTKQNQTGEEIITIGSNKNSIYLNDTSITDDDENDHWYRS